jgi:tetratricopeptide (TPR) repeat protein
MLRYLSIALLMAGLVTGVRAADKRKPPPAGLDSLTKREADSLSRELFGELKDEEKARRLFDNGKEDFLTGEAFTAEADSLRRTGMDTTLKKPSGVFGQIRQALGDTIPTSREMDTRRRAEAAYKRSAGEFEKALTYSPDLFDAQLWLAATYDRLKDWEKSAALYREILNQRQGEDRLWFNYGYAALQAGQFDKAVNGFEQALHIAVLVLEDSTKIPNRYRVFAGEAFLRTYQDRMALERFREALNYANPAEAAEIQRTIDWILWDDGGIAAAEYRDAAFQAENAGRWNDAREAYLAGIRMTRTARARDELSYRLALLEFQHGTRTDGLARMKELFDQSPDPPTEYRESYGKMLFGYAQQIEQESNVRGALSYYLQATKFAWSGQGAGYVEIARIAANDLDRAIENADKALSYPLTHDQQQAAYRILESAWRAKGNWEMMKKYRQLMETQP